MLDIKHLDEIATYNYKNKRNEFVDPDKITIGRFQLGFTKEKLSLSSFAKI